MYLAPLVVHNPLLIFKVSRNTWKSRKNFQRGSKSSDFHSNLSFDVISLTISLKSIPEIGIRVQVASSLFLAPWRAQRFRVLPWLQLPTRRCVSNQEFMSLSIRTRITGKNDDADYEFHSRLPLHHRKQVLKSVFRGKRRNDTRSCAVIVACFRRTKLTLQLSLCRIRRGNDYLIFA